MPIRGRLPYWLRFWNQSVCNHGTLLSMRQSDGLMQFVRRITVSELSGSSTIFVSMKSHLGHSNVRFSELFSRATRISSMCASQRPQQGH